MTSLQIAKEWVASDAYHIPGSLADVTQNLAEEVIRLNEENSQLKDVAFRWQNAAMDLNEAVSSATELIDSINYRNKARNEWLAKYAKVEVETGEKKL